MPLLTAEEEVDLAKQIEAGVYAKHALATGSSSLSATDLKEIAADGDRATERMIRANLGLISFVAKKYLGQGMDFEELLHEGIVGLVLAVHKFDYTRGVKFSTHAVWWIRYSLTVGTANTGRSIRIPRHLHAHLNTLRRAETELLQTKSWVSDGELSLATGFSEQQVRRLRELALPIRSLDEPLRDDSDRTVASLYPEQLSPSTFESLVSSRLNDRLNNLFGSLDELEMQYLDHRFGLSNGRPRSTAWIRKALGIPPRQATAIQRKIDSVMANALDAEGLADATG